MIEKLLQDYLTENRKWTYSDFSIEDIRTVGDLVMFREVSEGNHYFEAHEIPLLDILAWVHYKNM